MQEKQQAEQLEQEPELGQDFLDKLGLPERFQPVEIIGKGGMGVVVKARDTELEGFVAVKVMNLSGADATKRFLREARTLGKLAHPNIIQMRSMGISGSGQAYQVMELLKGATLSEILAKRKLTPVEFKRIFLQLVAGLKHASSEGIVHRDIKPSNIFIEQVESRGQNAKLLDFGIAQTDVQTQDRGLTATGVAMGSPLYMSPEQCRGEKVDALSDIYSLGCVMYECVTGAPPFRGESPLETMYQHISTESKPIVSTQPEIMAIGELIQRCLSKKKAERPQSYDEIEKDLKTLSLDTADSMGISMPEGQRSDSWKVPALALLLMFFTGIAVIVFVVGKSRNEPVKLPPGPIEKKIAELENSVHAKATELKSQPTNKWVLEHLSSLYLQLGDAYMLQTRSTRGVIDPETKTWFDKAKSAYAAAVVYSKGANEQELIGPEANTKWAEMVIKERDENAYPRAKQLLQEATAGFDKLKYGDNWEHSTKKLANYVWRMRSRARLGMVCAAMGNMKECLDVTHSCVYIVREANKVSGFQQHIANPYLKLLKGDSTSELMRELHWYAEPRTEEDKILLAATYLWYAEFLITMGDQRARDGLGWAQHLLKDTAGLADGELWTEQNNRLATLTQELDHRYPGAPTLLRVSKSILEHGGPKKDK